MADALSERGAQVLQAPAIRLTPLSEPNCEQWRRTLADLHAAAGWLVLPSPGSINHFIQVVKELDWTIGDLAGIHIATVGAGGARVLEHAGVRAEFIPSEPLGEKLAAELPVQADTLVIVAGSSQGRSELRDGLAARGCQVRDLPLYETNPDPEGLQAIGEALARLPASILILTSPSGVDAIVEGVTEPQRLSGAGWVAIGPTTMERIGERIPKAAIVVQASSPSPRGIIQAVAQVWRQMRGAGEGHATDPAE
jgi:uroporphyrinogen-III synthase